MKEVQKVDPDALHTMGQPDQSYVQPAFVTPGIPEQPLASRENAPDGKQADGTQMLQGFLQTQPVLNQSKG